MSQPPQQPTQSTPDQSLPPSAETLTEELTIKRILDSGWLTIEYMMQAYSTRPGGITAEEREAMQSYMDVGRMDHDCLPPALQYIIDKAMGLMMGRQGHPFEIEGMILSSEYLYPGSATELNAMQSQIGVPGNMEYDRMLYFLAWPIFKLLVAPPALRDIIIRSKMSWAFEDSPEDRRELFKQMELFLFQFIRIMAPKIAAEYVQRGGEAAMADNNQPES